MSYTKITKPISKLLLKELLPASLTIVEAGAHIGRDTVKMAQLWSESTIYAFEPVNELYTQLHERTRAYPHIHTYRYALSNVNSHTTMHVSSGRSTALSSLLKPVGSLCSHPNTIFTEQEVETITLDTWAAQYSVSHIDFVWLDTQGAELMIIKDSQLIQTAQLLLLEANLLERYQGNTLYDELRHWAELHNFEYLQESEVIHDKVNILFKHRSEKRAFD